MPQLGLAIPFLNEEAVANQVVRELTAQLDSSGHSFELVLVNNGSTDGTRAVLEALARSDPRLRVVDEPVRGYGRAVRRGVNLLTADIIGWIDGDGQMPPEAVPRLFSEMERRDADFGWALRKNRAASLGRRVASHAYSGLLRMTLGLRVRHVTAKPKLFKRSLWTRLQPTSDGWFIDTELILSALDSGARTCTITAEVRPRSGGASKVSRSIVKEYVSGTLAYRRRRKRARKT